MPIDLDKPRWDQSTYWGRARHFILLTNPLNAFATDKQLNEAARVVKEYRKTKTMPPGYDEDKLWATKYLYDSAFHPDTGEKMMRIGRMSAQAPMNTLIGGCMISFYRKKSAVLFWQWMNQSFNAVVNFTNRSGDAPITTKQLIASYFAACGGAMGIAFYLNSKVKGMNPLYARLVPFAAVCGANFINIPMMRSNEILNGTPVFTAEGQRVGNSKIAACTGILLVCISRIGMAVPGMTIVPIITNIAVQRGLFKANSLVVLPFQMSLVWLTVTFATPMCCAIFDQKAAISINFIESHLKIRQEDGMPDYLCFQCTAIVRSFKRFRDRCHRSHYALKEILSRNNEINVRNLKDLDRDLLGIMPQLSYVNLDKTHYEEVKFQWKKHNRIDWCNSSKHNIPVVHCSTLTADNTFNETTTTEELEFTKQNIKTDVDAMDHYEIPIEKDLTKDEPRYCDTTNDTEIPVSFMDDNDMYDSGNDQDPYQDADTLPNLALKVESTEGEVDGAEMDEEYASLVPISVKEAKAAVEVYKMFTQGKYHCEICNKAYNNEERMKVHLRMHDKHISGKFHCKLCQYYYKTEFLLKTHMTEKHMFKYLCRKCPEVSFDRISAKQHYIWVHLQKGNKKNSNWYESRPKWLNPRGGKRVKGVVTLKPIKKNTKLPEDFLVYSPIGHEEQYKLIQDRQNSRNYQEANYQCKLCYRGFRVMLTYEKHMKKHDPEYSGPLQCDICKIFFKDQRKLYKHMNITHLYKYSCQLCSFVCCNRGQAHMHYRWHKNVTYECPHCKREFLKASTRLTHIRIKHPSMCLCTICGHSFVSDSGLYCHKQIAHTEALLCPHCDRRFNMPSNRDRHLVVHTGEKRYQCQHCNRRFTQSSAVKLHIQTVHLKIPYAPWNKKNRKRRKELETAGMSTPLPLAPAPHKLAAFDAPADYLNAYITYNDD
uniref:C2H2-type domain-containing protein n=1 Tax=Heliothis virescens TaxID=7102 RepID=A0A2A4J6S1_HELVI